MLATCYSKLLLLASYCSKLLVFFIIISLSLYFSNSPSHFDSWSLTLSCASSLFLSDSPSLSLTVDLSPLCMGHSHGSSWFCGWWWIFLVHDSWIILVRDSMRLILWFVSLCCGSSVARLWWFCEYGWVLMGLWFDFGWFC